MNHDSNESSQQQNELWSHPYKTSVTCFSESVVWWNTIKCQSPLLLAYFSPDQCVWKNGYKRHIIRQTITMSCTVSLMFLLSGEMHSSYRNDGRAATCRWWKWSGWQPFCACRAQTHWFVCLVIDGASLSTQTVEKSSWQEEARRVEGLHFVIIVIWELKLRPLLAIEGCWYFVSAPRNLCMCHRLHFRLISDWTSPFRKQYRTATQNPWKDPRIKSNTRRT